MRSPSGLCVSAPHVVTNKAFPLVNAPQATAILATKPGLMLADELVDPRRSDDFKVLDEAHAKFLSVAGIQMPQALTRIVRAFEIEAHLVPLQPRALTS